MYAPQSTPLVSLGSVDDATNGVGVTFKYIPGGDAGAQATIAEMSRLIVDGSVSPLVRRVAVAIASTVAPRDYAAQLVAIREYLAAHVVFLRDPDGTELLHTPDLILSSILQNGVVHVDCDDVAILAGALGKSIGLLVRIVTVAGQPKVPGTLAPYAHTWTELSSPIDSPRWVDMDTTRSAQRIDPSLFSRSFIVDV